MRLLIITLLCLTVSSLCAQNSFDYELDALRAPASSAAGLLSISPSSIQRPEEPTDFLAILENSTSGLNKLPANFAVDIRPTWVFGSHAITIDDYRSNKVWDNVRQTFGLSAALRSRENQPNLNSAYGFNVSLLRGTMQPEIAQTLEQITGLLSESLDIEAVDAELVVLRKSLELANAAGDTEARDQILDAIIARTNELLDSDEQLLAREQALNVLSKKLDTITYRRIGWFAELAGAREVEFEAGTFDSSKAGRAAAWLTLGNNFGDHHALLGILRFQHDPALEFLDMGGTELEGTADLYDGGVRYIFEKQKWLASGELLVRNTVDGPVDDSSTAERWSLNLGYTVGKNSQLKLIFGRDFDQTNISGGNVLAGINFFKGLGNKREIKAAQQN